MTRFYRFSARDLLRDVPLSLLIGGVLGLLFWIGDEEAELWPMVLIAAWIGLSIYVVVTIALVLSSRPLARLAGWRLYTLLVPLMFTAAAGGFYLGVESLPLTNPLWRLATGESPPYLFAMFSTPDWPVMLAFAGALGAVVGLLFFRYELLKERLRSSVDRLKEREHAERELKTARKIQRRILGPTQLDGPGYRIAAENRPARYVAGDFYDVFPRTDGTLGLVAADVSGKGMGASLVMASVKGRLPLLAESRSVAETLTELNRTLVGELDRREFVALCYVRYAPETGDYELANAGLPEPYLLALAGGPRALPTTGPRLPLGVKGEIEYESVSGRLELGERLLLLTDGLPEVPVEDGSPLGYAAFEEMLGVAEGTPESWLTALLARLEERAGAEREDDWTALLLERVRRSSR